ncbi:MAG: chromosome segregation protein SMC [Elusimicrobia bacterium]|nr:chromosome segregation protein SMC [Elusimicrobiota bacterium]
MYLKSIELSGFKSFAEHTEIQLEPGITCIVGPNGCGKSNTVDAIRWSLGELSSRMLRSKSIVDVIFNGTKRLTPSGHAQVTLTFDNSDKALEIETTEAAVTRKVSRDGSSEYQINKAACRLKDIKHLFAGTGLGDDGYSIMEGSMVEFLLTAKPQERRYLFDEASGASRFTSRRDEAMSRLAKIDQDLDRVRDQIELLSTESKRIESQARKAKQFERLNNQKKNLEIKKVITDLEGLDQRSRQIEQERLTAKRQELEKQTSLLDEEYAESETARAQEIALEGKLHELQADFHEVIRARDVAYEKLRNLENKISEKDILKGNQAAEKEFTLKQVVEQAKEFEGVAKALAEKKQAFGQTGAQEPGSALDAEAPAAAERRDELGRETQNLKNEIARLEQEIVGLKNQGLVLTTELSQLEIELKHILKEHHREDVERLRIEKTKQETQARITEITAEIETLQNGRQEILDSESRLGGRARELENRLIHDIVKNEAALSARLEHWEKVLEKSPAVKGVLAVEELTRAWGSISGPLGKLIKTLPQHYGYLKDILADKLDWFLAANEEAALKAVRILANEKKGRAAFIILDKIAERPVGLASEFRSTGSGRIINLEQLLDQTAPEIKKIIFQLTGPLFIQGGAVYGDAVVRGGEDPGGDAVNVLSLTEEREAVAKSLKHLAVAKEEVQRQLTELQSERGQLTQKQNELSSDLENKRLESAKLNQEKNNLERDVEITAESIASLEKDTRERLAAAATKREDFLALDQTLKEQEGVLGNLKKTYEEAVAALQDAALEMNRQKETRLSYELANQEALREITVLQERSTQLQRSLALSQNQATRLEKSLDNLTIELSALNEEIGRLRLQVKALEKSHKEKGGALEKLQTTLSSAKVSRGHLENRIAEFETVIQSLKEEILQAEMEIKATEIERARLIEQACQIFQVTPEGLSQKIIQLKENEADMRLKEGETLEAALARVNEQITRLGQINFLAHEEYERLNERISFLNTQRDDILKAKEDVLAAILKINAQIEESFQVTFAAVREKFREIFGQLFEGGGEADLILTEGQDHAQKGVEIFAQPPGKKLQSISLLSQGEKALTAVSLLFAFFSIRPAPVCILDEIDAPLDEANILRFRKMLERFSEKCQFLIITHNKKTMEAARALYGVTMEELGVSKIISVKLEEVTAAV